MDHALQFFQNLDNLVWGGPAVGASGGDRNLPNPPFGPASDSLFTQGFSVDLYGR